MNQSDIRLQKWMAECGIGSRRACEKMIEEGRVKVNGRRAKLGEKIQGKKDVVLVDGKKIVKQNNNKYYIMLNKPRGYITTMKDEKNRKCVAQLVKNIDTRLYPVGRLDKDSEGLLFMTNDGLFANKLSHPSGKLKKTYRVTVKPKATEDDLVAFAVGMEIDGRKTKPCDVNVIMEYEDRSVLEFVLTEGLNRQIRKMCEKVGLCVVKLKRIKVGQVKLGMLRPGSMRNLNDKEVKSLLR